MGLIELGIMAAMVLFNGVFAGYEIALAAVTSPGSRCWYARTATGPRPPCT